MSRYLDKRLEYETHRGRVDRVDDLLARGAAINKLAADGYTPLSRAAFAGHANVVQALLTQGADPNAMSKDGASALFWAYVRAHENAAELLIAAGADVNAMRDSEYSVLNAAIGNSCSLELVKLLIRAGASLDHRFLRMDMLEYAEWCGREDLLPLLRLKTRRRNRRKG